MKTIEQYIETEMSGIIARKRNSPLPAVLVLVVGVGMLVLMSAARMGDILSATCLTVGLIGPTRSRMREKKVYLGGDDYRDIVEAINNGDFQKLADLSPVVSSNSAVRLLASRDGECVLVQAVRDQNGHFEPETEVHLKGNL